MEKTLKITLMFTLFFSMNIMVLAKEDEFFSVIPLKEKEGISKKEYFEYRLGPNEKKEMKLAIKNNSSEDMLIKIELANGATNDNGIITYRTDKERDSSLVVAFSDIAHTEGEVLVKKDSSEIVTVIVTSPEKEYKGMILGGIKVSDITRGTERQNRGSNTLSYVFGVVLKGKEEIASPKVVLNKLELQYKNKIPYVMFNLRNKDAAIIDNMSRNIKVIKKDTGKVIYEKKTTGIRMAPNSNFNTYLKMDVTDKLEGDYVVAVSGEVNGDRYSIKNEMSLPNDKHESSKVKGQNTIKFFYIVLCMIIFAIYIERKKEGSYL